jgi:Tol biopolymer transport system component
VLLANVNSGQDESAAALSSDGLTLYFSSARAGTSNDVMDMDLWLATRDSTALPFGMIANVTRLNSPYYDGGLSLSSDGRELFFVSGRPGGTGDWDVYVATRANTSEPFAPPREARELNSSTKEWETALSTDGLTIYLSSERDEPLGSDIFVAHRESREAAFGSPVPLRSVNSPFPEVNPVISPDGMELYFGSMRPGGLGDRDIWRSTWRCPP